MSLSPPLSPSPPSPSSSHPSSSLSPASAYAPAHSETSGAPLHTRARSGSASRTWEEAQAEESRQREQDNQRAREMAQDGTGEAGAISAGELRAEMETLLSLRRRSLSQPASVDPDLPPPSPTSPTQPSYPHHSSHPQPSTSRPQLSLQIIVPATSPGGAPLSPTAPTAAETGTLVRRKSSVSTRLPSDHPLPSPPLPSPTGSAFSASSPDGVEAAHTSQDLFWLPASLHPELAPQEFKAFIREQTRPDALARRTSMGGRGGYAGAGGGRVDRKKSMLRGEYKPRQGDGVEEEGQPRLRERRPEGLSRTASEGSKRTTTRVDFEELTIRDLQRLEELAAHAEAESAKEGEEEGERLGRVLRRSLSLNPNLVAAAAAGAHLPSASEPSSDLSSSADGDSPLIVHSPGQILRRTARTKIRKAGLVGDGGGHRFGPSRRVRSASGDMSSHTVSAEDDESIGGNTSVDSLESGEAMQVASEIVDGDPGGRSIASSPSSDNQHEVQYFEDAPSSDIIEDFPPSAIDGAWLSDEPSKPTSPVDLNAPLPPPPSQGPPPVRPPLHSAPSLPVAPSPSSADYDWATHHQPQPQQQQLPPVQPYVPPPPVPAPLPERKDSVPQPPASASSASSRSSSMSDGKKKSGWARLGLSVKASSSDDKKKSKGKDKGDKEMEKVVEAAVKQQQLDREKEARDTRDREEKERKDREKEQNKEKEGGFFGGLFGKRKSEQEPVAPPTPSPPPEVRTPPPPPTASGALAPDGRYINFYRLPIHVERAVYRLSHIKLANPRRPLYEQVLISNLMFWYLSIINKPVAPPPAAPTPIPIPVPQMRGGPDDPQQQQAGPPSGSKEKRGGLSKPAGEGQQGRRGASRSAEMPVKQPQFEQQNRQIEQEYGGGGQGGAHHHQQQMHSQQQQQNTPPSHHAQPPQPHHQQHLSQAPPHHSSSNSHPPAPPIPHVVVAPSPSTLSDSPPQHTTSRSPDRASAPADLYRASSTSSSSLSSDEEDDDDRPLGSLPAHRESYPPHRPTPISSYPKHDSGFQVTSRKVSPTPSSGPRTSTGSAEEQNRRRVSNISQLSTGSFDASEIIDAYSGSGSTVASPATSPVLSFKEVAPLSGEGLAPSADSAAVTHAPLFGNVAPRRRGDSLVNRGGGSGEDLKADELVRVRSKSPPLRQISPVSAGAGGREYL